MFGLEIGMATLDAAGCNWILYQDTLLTNTFHNALPWYIIKKYPSVDFDVKCLMKDQINTLNKAKKLKILLCAICQ